MPAVHGSDAYVSIDGNNITIYTDQASLDKMIETAETTAFSNDDKTFIAGLRDSTLSIGGYWDSALDGFAANWDDGAFVPCIVGPNGSVTGRVRYTLNALITNYAVDAPVGARVSWSASLQRTGATTRDVFP
jgi:hypothetical protein